MLTFVCSKYGVIRADAAAGTFVGYPVEIVIHTVSEDHDAPEPFIVKVVPPTMVA